MLRTNITYLAGCIGDIKNQITLCQQNKECALLCEVLKDKQLEVPAFTFKSNSLFLHNLTDFIRQVLVQSPSSRARSKRVMSESDETMFDVLDTSRDVLDTSRES